MSQPGHRLTGAVLKKRGFISGSIGPQRGAPSCPFLRMLHLCLLAASAHRAQTTSQASRTAHVVHVPQELSHTTPAPHTCFTSCLWLLPSTPSCPAQRAAAHTIPVLGPQHPETEGAGWGHLHTCLRVLVCMGTPACLLRVFTGVSSSIKTDLLQTAYKFL